jgi:hypothetical protein
MIYVLRHKVGSRPSEAHGGGWEGLWRGGMGTDIDLPHKLRPGNKNAYSLFLYLDFRLRQ